MTQCGSDVEQLARKELLPQGDKACAATRVQTSRIVTRFRLSDLSVHSSHPFGDGRL